MRILDHAWLTRQSKVVRPGNPDGSLLLDLVEGGSMPPGRLAKVPAADRAVLRQWVRDGAAAFPPDSGRDYLLRQMAEDVGRRPAARRPYVRYLSLNHLPALSGIDRKNRLARLHAVLRDLSPKGKAPDETLAVEVEPTGTLLRIDLRELGWDRKPFKEEALTLFDLLLLEYPYGVLPAGPAAADVEAFLRQTRQVQPAPYLRADWLVRAVSRPPLRREFLAVLGKPTDRPAPREAMDLFDSDEVTFDQAVAELESGPGDKRMEEALALASLRRAERIKRAMWEQHYPAVVRRLGGTPLLPLDGLTWLTHAAGSSLKVRLRLIDPKARGLPDDPPARDRFIAGKDRYSIWIHSNQDVVVELVYTDSRGAKTLVGKRTHSVRAGDPLVFSGVKGEGLRAMDNFEGKQVTESFTLYAYSAAALAGGDYPKGKVIRAEGMADRFLHPLYNLGGGKGGEPPDPNRMVKITVGVAFVKP